MQNCPLMSDTAVFMTLHISTVLLLFLVCQLAVASEAKLQCRKYNFPQETLIHTFRTLGCEKGKVSKGIRGQERARFLEAVHTRHHLTLTQF